MRNSLPVLASIIIAVLFATVCMAGAGAQLYAENCAECHGASGEGALAPALNKQGLLTTVGEEYIMKTMVYGRPIRGCPSYSGLIPTSGMKQIAAYMKGWQKGPLLSAPSHKVEPKKTPRGVDLFTLCGGCHGLEGEGAMGPPLLDAGFLASSSDEDLRRTIMYGRPGTPMKGYIKGMGGLAELTVDEIDEIISYMRYRQKIAEDAGADAAAQD